MNAFTNKVVVTSGSSGSGPPAARRLMNSFFQILIKFGILKEDLDYQLIRASMVSFLAIRNGLSTKRRY